MAADIPEDFRKELVDLFVQEAHEWLQNIHVALDELQQGPTLERHAKLIETISAGVTNLGGSAATINLSDVKEASFAAIPYIQALQDPQKPPSVQDFLSFCKQLGLIHKALIHATGVSFEEDGSEEAAEKACTSLSPGEFLRTLQELQSKQHSGAATGRNLIRSLIEQMEGQIQAGVERIDPAVIHGYLARVSEAEEAFLKAIDEGVPEIAKKLGELNMDGNEVSSQIRTLEDSLEEVARLRMESQQVNAASAMMFFTGLHSLLTVVMKRQVVLGATRIESVRARLHMMGDTIRQWAEHGRAQRAAIDQSLPVNHS